MYSPEPLYVELDGRLFEYHEVEGYPRNPAGQPVKCRVDLSRQIVEASEFLSAAELAKLLAQAMGFKPGDAVWRLVPCVGRIKAEAGAAS